MAELRKVARSNPLSTFQQVAPESGGGFRILAQAMDTAYRALEPSAIDEMERQGAERGRDAARSIIGANFSGRGNYRDAIASIESGGNYNAVGPTAEGGDRAYGKYQVMGANIGPWTERHLGRRMSATEFLADPAAQDAVFDAEFGSYVAQTGSASDAASMWFTGRPLAQGAGRSDVLGTTGAEYVRRFNEALGPGAEVVLRTPEGKVEGRRFSPLASPILQAHDAAAQVAFNAEVLNSSAVELTNLANAYTLDPGGYAQAAQQFIDTVVENAPEDYKTDLRSALSNESRKSYLGLVEARHRDIRRRATNETSALVDRWQAQYADALASGNEEEIEVAEANLNSAIEAYGAIPGTAWGPEQSENVRIDARKEAERIRKTRDKEELRELNQRLNRIVDSASAGRRDADEALAFSPEIMERSPELAADARAAISFRDNLPNFQSQNRAMRDLVIQKIQEDPVENDREIGLGRAAMRAHEELNRRWEDRPMETAFQVMQEPPPSLIGLGPGTEDQAVAAMQARREYANGLVTDGYIDEVAFLTEGEADSMATALAIGQEPEVRAAIAASIVAGFGEDAARVFAEIGDSDPVLRMAGQMMARGGNPAVAAEMLRGQALLEQNLVQIPQKGTRITAFSGDVSTALTGIPGAERIQGDVMQAASALYAARAQGVDPSSDAAQDLWEGAIQSALGQTQSGNKVRGGIQDVWDQPVLLPPTISGADVAHALSNAFSLPHEGNGFTAGLANLGAALSGDIPADEDFWGDMGVPHLAGEPLTSGLVRSGKIRLVPVPEKNKSSYRMEYAVTGDPVVDKDGKLYVFDIGELVSRGMSR